MLLILGMEFQLPGLLWFYPSLFVWKYYVEETSQFYHNPWQACTEKLAG